MKRTQSILALANLGILAAAALVLYLFAGSHGNDTFKITLEYIVVLGGPVIIATLAIDVIWLWRRVRPRTH